MDGEIEVKFRCPCCHESGQNSYWLIDHLEHCIERWHHEQRRHRDDDHHDHDDRRWHHRHHYRDGERLFTWAVTVPVPHHHHQQHRKVVRLHMADFSLLDSDAPFEITVVLTDAKGNPTTPDQTPVWAEDSNGTVITLTPSADGMSAVGTPVAPGTSNITFSVTDNDGTKIVGTGSVQVNPGEAVTANLTFTPGSTPAPTPAPTPTP